MQWLQTSYLWLLKEIKEWSILNGFGIDLFGMFVVKRHESLNCEETDMEMLKVGDNVLAYNTLVNTHVMGIFLFELLKDGTVENVVGPISNTDLKFLSSIKVNICQKVYGASEVNEWQHRCHTSIKNQNKWHLQNSRCWVDLLLAEGNNGLLVELRCDIHAGHKTIRETYSWRRLRDRLQGSLCSNRAGINIHWGNSSRIGTSQVLKERDKLWRIRIRTK